MINLYDLIAMIDTDEICEKVIEYNLFNLLHIASIKLSIVSARMDQVDQQRTIGDSW